MILLTSIKTLPSQNIFSLPVTQQDVSPYDDENQLAAEMVRTSLDITHDQPLPDIDPDDFEKLYRWFYS